MKRHSLWKITLCVAIFLAGCGTQVPLSGRAYEEYQKSIKPYIAYWTKDGMTEDGRLWDWVGCGGGNDGSFSWKTKEQMPGESNEQSSRRQRDDHQRCMIQRGYRYTGDCSSPEMKSRPLCGAP